MMRGQSRDLISQYLKEVKCLLPIVRIEEGAYFRKMEAEMRELLENDESLNPSFLPRYLLQMTRIQPTRKSL